MYVLEAIGINDTVLLYNLISFIWLPILSCRTFTASGNCLLKFFIYCIKYFYNLT
jgi:hypothetical protein